MIHLIINGSLNNFARFSASAGVMGDGAVYDQRSPDVQWAVSPPQQRHTEGLHQERQNTPRAVVSTASIPVYAGIQNDLQGNR